VRAKVVRWEQKPVKRTSTHGKLMVYAWSSERALRSLRSPPSITLAHQPEKALDVYSAISEFRQSPPATVDMAAAMLSSYTLPVQKQLINAVYLGRDHIHLDTLQEDADLDSAFQIPREDYAQILREKCAWQVMRSWT
jgi:hypothetical protein